ncbi:MAG: alginate lyase family protein [Phycisphaerales bacterium]|nr:alginate lyase family protein [Phycisphaerales bacterium]
MQSPLWYVRRLGTMSPGEIVWRVHHALRSRLDSQLWPMICRRTSAERVLEVGAAFSSRCAQAIGAVSGAALGAAPGAVSGAAATADDGRVVGEAERAYVLSRAQAAMEHRFSFFDLRDIHLGDPIRWNREVKANTPTPMDFAMKVDYRDSRVTGDCKFAWEPNRHAHLVPLAQAYHLTGDIRYAEETVRQIESWIEQCPFGYGMNWRSPLELAIRLINWAWTLGLIADSGLPAGVAQRRIHEAAYRHLWEIRRKYSRYSSANNHLIGEAAGVWIGATAFRPFRGSESVRREAREILLREMERQTYADGGNREQALSYHLFVLEFFLLSGLVARNVSEDFPPSFWSGAERMVAFLAELSAGGEAPMYGDADDGCVLGVGGPLDLTWSLPALGAVLLDKPAFAARTPRSSDRLYWFLGRAGVVRHEQLLDAKGTPEPTLLSKCFPQSGHYILQAARAQPPLSVSAIVDGGELGFGSIAAHGHADALSVVLRLNGRTVLCDPGTYDYFTFPPWRRYFRGTSAHNTVEIDGQDQSAILGPFMWGRRANCRLVRWQPSADGGEVCLEHDGYARLPGRVMHRRTVRLSIASAELVVLDELEGAGNHVARQFWHLGRGCEIRPEPDNAFLVEGEGVHVRFELDPALKLTFHRGESDPIIGWFSAGYHRKEPIVTVAAAAEFTAHVLLRTRVRL